jgi:D-glycero-D-manno-heptose 1,7-bisphosphate phosphatase
MMAMASGVAVFLDRDGTLIRDVGYLRNVDELELLPGVPQALALLRNFGFKLVVVTNQSAVARGWLSEVELSRIHDGLAAKLARSGIVLDAIYYCPHHPVEGTGAYRIECACRKPRGGMIERACADLGIDPTASYVVGDKEIDVELSESVGATAVRVGAVNAAASEGALAQPVLAKDLLQAAHWIIKNARRKARCTQLVK